MLEPVQIGDATLYCGNALEWIGAVPPCFRVNSVISDPPYGVGLGTIKSRIGKTGYNSFDDTPEEIERVAVPVIEWAIKHADCVAITPGARCAFSYPQPDEIGCVYVAAGAGLGRWGFITSHPVLFWGPDPHKRQKSNSFACNLAVEKNGHPCPKPIEWMRWLVARASLKGDIVIDPFMGSGTTGVACAKLGRKFIGIELEPKYFDIACKRIEEAYAQPDLFIEPPKPATPETLL